MKLKQEERAIYRTLRRYSLTYAATNVLSMVKLKEDPTRVGYLIMLLSIYRTHKRWEEAEYLITETGYRLEYENYFKCSIKYSDGAKTKKEANLIIKSCKRVEDMIFRSQQ